MISKRQEELLYIIIQEYIANAMPIGSKFIMSKYMKDISAATIRNDMATLEKKGLIQKVHNSSGRIPSTEGYKYYEKNFTNNSINIDLQKALKKIFVNRSYSIEQIIENSVNLISDAFKLSSVVTTIDNDILIKRIDLVPMSEKAAIIMVITSDGNIQNNLIEFENTKQLNDTSICVRIFNDRLIDTSIKDLEVQLNVIKSIIREKVNEYEFIIEEIVNRVFIFNNKTNLKNKINGQSNLISQPEFREQEKLVKILKLLEDSSVWEIIAMKQYKSGGKTTIAFGDEFKKIDTNVSIVSTQIPINKNSSTCISLVGPTRMDYTNVKNVLDFIKTEMEKIWKE